VDCSPARSAPAVQSSGAAAAWKAAIVNAATFDAGHEVRDDGLGQNARGAPRNGPPAGRRGVALEGYSERAVNGPFRQAVLWPPLRSPRSLPMAPRGAKS
jgi:hypothetical protein